MSVNFDYFLLNTQILDNIDSLESLIKPNTTSFGRVRFYFNFFSLYSTPLDLDTIVGLCKTIVWLIRPQIS